MPNLFFWDCSLHNGFYLLLVHAVLDTRQEGLLGLVVKQFQLVPEPEPSYIGKVSAMFGY